MVKSRYICLAVAACVIVSLSSCSGGTPTAENSQPANSNSATQTTEAVNHSSHGSKAKVVVPTVVQRI